MVRGSNPSGGKIFRTCALEPTQPPVQWVWGLSRGKERPGRDADPSPLLMPWSRKGRAILLQPLRAVRPVQSLSDYTRVHFTLLNHTIFNDRCSIGVLRLLLACSTNMQKRLAVDNFDTRGGKKLLIFKLSFLIPWSSVQFHKIFKMYH
jgi:hypothetical protein